jgi:hypothetical protein
MVLTFLSVVGIIVAFEIVGMLRLWKKFRSGFVRGYVLRSWSLLRVLATAAVAILLSAIHNYYAMPLLEPDLHMGFYLFISALAGINSLYTKRLVDDFLGIKKYG